MAGAASECSLVDRHEPHAQELRRGQIRQGPKAPTRRKDVDCYCNSEPPNIGHCIERLSGWAHPSQILDTRAAHVLSRYGERYVNTHTQTLSVQDFSFKHKPAAPQT